MNNHSRQRHSAQRFGVIVSMCICAWGIASCQSNRVAAPRWDEPGVEIVWPLPPDSPRVQYVGSIESADNTRTGTRIGGGIKALLLGKQSTDLVKPMALARNDSGLLVVTDPAIPTVHFFDLDAGTYWRPKKKFAHILNSPVGVAVSSDSIAYVTDSSLGQVLVFSRQGTLIDRFGEGLLERPTGVALNPGEDRLYVVDTLSNQVFTFDLDGNKLKAFGSRGADPGQFNYPTYITTLKNGDLCVSDSLNFRVQIFNAKGKFIRLFGQAGNTSGAFSRPKGIASDTQGNLYIVDTAFENVQIFDRQGDLLLGFGGPGTGPGEFTLPVGICLDSENRIWVADSFNKRILIFRLVKEGV